MPARTMTVEDAKALIGQEVGVSGWIQITQDMIDQFADLTGDHQWIHVDEERARREQFGSTIAHGFLTLSLMSHMAQESVRVEHGGRMTINYGLNRVRFVSPVLAGSRVRGHFALKEAGENQVIWAVTVELAGSEKPALVAEWIARFY